MKIDPVSFLFNKNAKTNKKFYFISGNEITLIEKVKKSIIDAHQKNGGVNIKKIDDIKNYSDDKSLFESKKIFVGTNCKGFDEKNLNQLKKIDGIFIFIFENSPKIKRIKQFLVKDNDSYLINCYEIDRDSKIIILNYFLKENGLKLNEEIYWLLIEKLESKYGFFENSLNKLLSLNNEDITYENIGKLITKDDSSKEKLFFLLFKRNREITELYREKIITSNDVNDLYYYCKFFCNLIIDSSSEAEYAKKIPIYLFKEKKFLIDIFKRYNSEKKKMLLKLLSSTERALRENNKFSLFFGLRLLLNIKKITVS